MEQITFKGIQGAEWKAKEMSLLEKEILPILSLSPKDTICFEMIERDQKTGDIVHCRAQIRFYPKEESQEQTVFLVAPNTRRMIRGVLAFYLSGKNRREEESENNYPF